MEKLKGLTAEEAGAKLKEFGLNVLPEKPPTPDAVLLLRQVQSPLIYILLFAAAVSSFLKDWTDSVVILLAVVVNTVLGFYQERKAERGLLALKQMLTPQARVVRDGKTETIQTNQIVPGDIVLLSAGDRVAADGVLLDVAELTINEAILTGESIPVVKRIETKSKTKQNNKEAENTQRVFMGTTVVGGLGKFQVTTTGLKTEVGKIAESLAETKEGETPLQKRLQALAKTLTVVVALSAIFIFAVGTWRGESWVEMFTTSVAVAVAAIPEGLVIALTAILALGMQRILKRKALVRKLVVAETLGTVTVIATDKTGTLTHGRLQVVKTDFVDREKALTAATLANHMVDPLEISLWDYLKIQPKFDPEQLTQKNKRTYTLPFDSERKFSATAYDKGIYIIGAPEVLLSKSSLHAADRKKVEATVEEWGRKGLRVLAMAQKAGKRPHALALLKEEKNIRGVEFLGLVGFADPVRAGVKDALALARGAGIAVKVVTGDYRWTAEAILRDVGIHIKEPATQIIEGEELEKLSLAELVERVDKVMLFARVTPSQKLKIVEALKKRGEVVALLGDGVNDAPALKRADIGIVVGEASDVARETADLVLLDSNFSTIVAAVEEGRGIFINIQKVMTYLMSDTFAEVILIFLGLIMGVPLPLTAAQILWINLVTDTFPTLALTMEPKEKHLLKRPPISPKLPILTPSIIGFMLVASFSSGIVIFVMYFLMLKNGVSVETARLVAFTAFGIKSLFYVFSLRDRNKMLWQMSHLNNPYLLLAVAVGLILQLLAVSVGVFHRLLETRWLTIQEWGYVIGASVAIVGIIEVAKVFRKLFFYEK